MRPVRLAAAILLVLQLLARAQEPGDREWLPLSEIPPFTPDPERASRPPGYLGVQLDDASLRVGCRITSVVEGSAAEAAGLEVGDVIVSFDRIRTPNGSMLGQVVRSKAEGDTIEAVVFSDGVSRKVPITMKKVGGRVQLGIRFEPGAPVSEFGGVKVGSIVPRTPAAEAGLREGDVLVEIDGVPVPDRESLTSLVQSLAEGDEVGLAVRRGEEALDLTLRLGAHPDLQRRTDRTRTARSFRLAVLLVEFADVAHHDGFRPEHFETMFFSRGEYTGKSPSGDTVYGSVADYYDEVSNGVFRLEGKVFDWLALETRKEDLKNRNIGRDAAEFLGDAIRRLLAREGDGALDGFGGLAVIYAGRVEHPRGRVLWPHRSSVRVGRRTIPYYVMSERRGSAAAFAGIATHCHEFGHMLGLPDQYSEVPGKGMELGVWCLMASGHRGSRGAGDHRPLHLCPWCKIRVGWLSATSVDPRRPQRIALGPVERSRDQCVLVPLRSTGTEYLLLDYRAGLGFDEMMPRSGLLVWHVSSGFRVDLLEAHGELHSTRRLREVPFPLPGRDSILVDEDLPDLKTSDRGRWRVLISRIQEEKGKRVLFEIGPAPGRDPEGE